jgi:hypothetical protein
LKEKKEIVWIMQQIVFNLQQALFGLHKTLYLSFPSYAHGVLPTNPQFLLQQ